MSTPSWGKHFFNGECLTFKIRLHYLFQFFKGKKLQIYLLVYWSSIEL